MRTYFKLNCSYMEACKIEVVLNKGEYVVLEDNVCDRRIVESRGRTIYKCESVLENGYLLRCINVDNCKEYDRFKVKGVYLCDMETLWRAKCDTTEEYFYKFVYTTMKVEPYWFVFRNAKIYKNKQEVEKELGRFKSY